MAPQRITPGRVYEENEYDAVKGEINSSQVLVFRDREKQKEGFERIAIYIEETASQTGKRAAFCDVRTGKRFLSSMENILGVLKPESITEKDKLMLALIKPVTEESAEEFTFWGYCYLKNGLHQEPVRLTSERELRAYTSLQKQYQSRLLVCDDEDYIVMDIQEGRLIFPDREQMLKEQPETLEFKERGGNAYERH